MDPLGNVTMAEYGADYRLSRLIAPTGESKSYTWSCCGNPTSVTDELGHTVSLRYDNLYRRLSSLTDTLGNTTRYTYDLNGNRLSTIHPDASVEAYADYTSAGLPQTSTNRRGQVISYTYNTLGRVSQQVFEDGSVDTFEYDARGNLLTVTEHPASGPDRVTTYAYDYATDGDRLRKVTYSDGRWVSYTYDTFGRRRSTSDSTGQTSQYDYDSAGRLWTVRRRLNHLLVEYLYNAAGLLEHMNKGNGTYTTHEYDAAGEILHLVNSAADGTVNSRFDYTYDSRGRRSSMSTVDGEWTYQYDGAGQLTLAVFASTNPAIPDQDLAYRYDAMGNRTSVVLNGVTTSYDVNNLNEYTSVGGVAYQYDANGNLTSDGVRTYDYDAQNRLVRVTGPDGVTEYEYDAFGNRTATVVDGQPPSICSIRPAW